MKKKIFKIIGMVTAAALVAAAVIIVDPFDKKGSGADTNAEIEVVNPENDEVIAKSGETTEEAQECCTLTQDSGKEYDPLSIVVSAECVREEDEAYIEHESIDGKYITLTYDNEKEAADSLAYYEENTDSDAGYVHYCYIMDTGASNYSYLSSGPKYIESGELVDDILEKYGSADNLEKVVVGIVDTGINYNHSFLKNMINTAKCKDFYLKDGVNSYLDDNGHGSHVAGIIVDTALTNVELISYKVTDSSGSSTSDYMYDAIAQAIEDEVDVINISMGGTGSVPEIDSIIKKAVEAGINVAVAAGNESMDTEKCFPASCEYALTVSATDSYGNFSSSYSNYGDEVDLAAPGNSIKSTYISGTYSYATLTGTSMATPFVSAACALVKTWDPSLTGDEVEKILKDNAIDLGTTGFDVKYGYGEINLKDLFTTTPVIKTEGGEYDSNVVVTITCSDSNARIYYTTDGSIPDSDGTNAGSKLYTGPITLTESAVVTAIAKSDANADSDFVKSTYYIKGGAVASDFETDLNGNITGYNGNQTMLVLPDTLDGKAVTGISAGAFAGENAAKLTHIVLNKSLTKVSENAFTGCTNLKYVFYQDGSNDFSHLTLGAGGNVKFINAVWIDSPSLTIIREPDQTTYTSDDSLDLTGGRMICVSLNQNSKKYEITEVDMTAEGVTVSNYDPDTAGNQSVTISYNGLSTVLNVQNLDRSANTLQVSVSAVSYTITGQTETQSGRNLYYYAPGTEVTLTYTDTSTTLTQWTNSMGQVLSQNAEYTFTLTEDVEIYEIHTSNVVVPDEALVIFRSPYGQVIKAQTYTESDTIDFPDGPSYLGHTFTGWDKDSETIIAEMKTSNIIEVKPVYSTDTATHSVTVYIVGVPEKTVIQSVEDASIISVNGTENASNDDNGTVNSGTGTENISDVSEDSNNDGTEVKTDENISGGTESEEKAPDETTSEEDAFVKTASGENVPNETALEENASGENESEENISAKTASDENKSNTLSERVGISTTGTRYDACSKSGILNNLPYTVTAPTYKGYTFNYWQDEDGHILSYNAAYTVYATKDVELYAVYVASTESLSAAEPVVTITQVLAKVLSDSTSGTETVKKYLLSYMESYSLPDTVELIKVGFVMTTADNKATDNKLVTGESLVKTLSSTGLTDSDGTFIQTLTTTVADKVVYMRGFVQYKNKTTGVIDTTYSDIVSGSYNSIVE